jgi:rhodanese-related sulfurtransferase
MEKGYKNVKVVDGGWKAMMKVGFPYIFEGKMFWPQK